MMLLMIKMLIRFWNDDRGATAIEYALIAAGIALLLFASVGSIGTQLNTKFSSVNSSLK